MRFKKTNIALSAVVLGLGMVGTASAAGKINFVSWGGAYTASQVKACIEHTKLKLVRNSISSTITVV